MRWQFLSAGVAALATAVSAQTGLPLVESNKLRRVLLRSELLKKGEELQALAYATPDRNRAIFTPGHESTLQWIYNQMKALGDYYDVYYHEFQLAQPYGNFSTTDGASTSAIALTFSPLGSVTAPVAYVPNLGCAESDFAGDLTGKIVLVERGVCTFAVKAGFAKAKGAVATVIFTDTRPLAGGTLGAEGDWPLTAMIARAYGLALVEKLKAGPVTATFVITTLTRPTRNVIAQTKGGDQNNVVISGAHSDSVPAGPGINDNGSGTIAQLEIAKQLTKYSVNNAVRFAWWTAEEVGLVGSTRYVQSLNATELAKIGLYLNFDMIASPNYVYAIYDGDGNAFNISGPPGSGPIEKLFEDYFTNDAGLNHVPTAFTSRSDYAAFAAAGISVGGLFTGAEQLKTVEEERLFGGKAGVAYDVNYHLVGDTVQNLNVGAWIQNSKAIAHAIATYARSTASLGLGKREEHIAKRSEYVQELPSDEDHISHSIGGGCSHAPLDEA